MKNKTVNSPARRDIFLITGLLLLALCLFFGIRFLRPQGTAVQVRVNGELIGTYSLGTDREIQAGEHCTVLISGGKVQMKEADCKNRICVHHAPIDRGGECIVCLPNRVTVKVLSDDAPDAVVY